MKTQRKAVIMGATSGMGKKVALLLLREGWKIGIAGRRCDELSNIRLLAPEHIKTKVIDVCAKDAPDKLMQLIDELGGMDLYIHSSGYGKQNMLLDMDIERQTQLTNGVGFVAMIDAAYNYFASDGRHGHIAAITSVAGTKGLGAAPAYAATKRFQWTYLEALAQQARMRGLDIVFTDIRPGFVATDFLGNDRFPMLMEKEFVAQKIVSAIRQRRRHIVIDWRYKVICFFWRMIPGWLWERISIKS